jgi:hypothetical protein
MHLHLLLNHVRKNRREQFGLYVVNPLGNCKSQALEIDTLETVKDLFAEHFFNVKPHVRHRYPMTTFGKYARS